MYYYKDPEIDLNEIVSSQLPRIPVDVTIKGIVLLYDTSVNSLYDYRYV